MAGNVNPNPEGFENHQGLTTSHTPCSLLHAPRPLLRTRAELKKPSLSANNNSFPANNNLAITSISVCINFDCKFEDNNPALTLNKTAIY